MTAQGCPIDMEERRRDGDRLIRLETVVERIEADMGVLTQTYKEIAQQQQVMFVENLKSQGALQSAVQELMHVIQEQKPRVDELEENCITVRNDTSKIIVQQAQIAELEKKVANHEQWKWKITGGIVALVFVLEVGMKLIL